MKINHNIPALRTLNQLAHTNKNAQKTMLRLSSGLRINSSSDDAAGMAIAQKMDSQIKGLDQANRNSLDAISLVQIAEGAYNEVHSILQRMRELSIQSANDTNDELDKEAIQTEIDELTREIEAIMNQTEFNKKPLLSENVGDIPIQTGANKDQMMNMDFSLVNLKTNVLDVIEDIDVVTSQETSQRAIAQLDQAIENASASRSQLGSYQNRLEYTVTNLNTSEENMTASLSRIQDADMAEEMANFTRYNILSQAATAMLAQANQRPQQVLQLLQR